jgi:hypothetical protein
MEFGKRKVGKECKHKTKATLVTEEAVENYHFELEQTIRDYMVILEEEVWYV